MPERPPAKPRAAKPARSVGAPSQGRTSAERESVPDAPDYTRRVVRLARTTMDLGLTALLITNPKDVAYLTGFAGGDSYLLVPAGGAGGSGGAGLRPVVISDFRYQEELEPVKANAEVVIRRRGMVDAVAEVATGLLGEDKSADRKLGVQAEQMTISERAALGRRVGSKRLTDTHGLVAQQRVVKDAFEIAQIKKAAKVQEQSLTAVLPSVRPGASELEIAAKLEMEMKSRGSSEPGFATIVAAGPAGSLPHYRPSPRKLKANQPVLIDWGAVVGGYHSDMTRVFTLGKWPEKIREIYKVVLEAQELAARALAPGKSTAEIDRVAREHIASAGYAENFGHGLGHGLGLNGHEEPRLTNMLAAATLRPGMVVTVEPGIYLPGVGGVRIEDDYVITESGADNLCSLKKDADWAVL
jgi:Xaa-Pro aminopeptidase